MRMLLPPLLILYVYHTGQLWVIWIALLSPQPILASPQGRASDLVFEITDMGCWVLFGKNRYGLQARQCHKSVDYPFHTPNEFGTM